MVFSPATVSQAFEASTGVRLHAGPRESRRFELLRRRLGLPQVDSFDSSPADSAPFGGTVTVRVRHTNKPDRGVRDHGLEIAEIERGPQAGTPVVVGSAERANVEVTLYREGAEIDDSVQELWAELRRFLHRL